ncbi:YadA-like family protein [Muribacter muris]|nr:YadA-like family protein [Muribacter muris]
MSGDAGLSNFTLGAGKASEKITVNKDADKNHFDIVSGNETYLTTAVDGRNVKVDLTEKTKNAIDQVDQNKANIANNTKNITNNAQNIINLQNEVAKGWNVTTSKSGTGNVNGASLSKVAMGETVTIDAGDNINITQTGKKITIATSSTPNFSSVNSGNLTIRPNGKVDFGNNRLTNVANGTSGTDAVNLNQLNASMAKAKTEVKAGNNVNVTKSSAADGHDVYTVNADKSTVSNGSDKVKVTSTVGANNTTNYAVDLSDTAKQQLAKEESVNSTTSNLIVTENGKNSTGGKNYSVNLNTTLDLTNAGSVKTGDTVLNSTGVTIKNGPSVTNTGVNAGNKKVTNVTNGTIAPTSTDAVNGSQLYATNQNVTNLTTEVNKGWNVTTSKSGTGNVSNNTTAKVAMGDTVTLDAGDNINITQSGKKVTIATSSTPNFSSVNSGNLTIRPNGKVDFGNNTLTNVAAPTNNTDVANKKYVDDGRTTVNSTDGSVTVNGTGTNPKNYDLSVNMSKVANDVKLKYKGDNNTSGENKLADTVTFKGSTDIVTNASNGQVAFDLADATKNKINNAIQNFTVGADKNNTAAGVNVTNGGRFDIVGKEGNYIETNVSGSNITVALNQNATEAIEKAHKGFSLKAQDGNNVTKQLGEAIEVEGGNSNINTTVENGKLKVNLNNTLDLSDVGSVKLGDTTLNSTGLTINNGPKVTKDGIDAGNKKVTNVTEGELSNTSKDAVNGSQLYATNQNVTNISNEVAKGWNITTSKSGTGNVANNTTENVKMGELVTIEAGDNINITQAAKKITIATSLTPNFTNVTTGNLTVNPNGKVDFGGNNLSNVGTPVADNDATTKKYVDDGRTTVNSTDGSVNVTKSDSSNPTNYDLSVNMSKVAQDVSFKYKGDNNTTGENKLSEPVNFKGSDYVTTNASNGTVAFDLSNNTKQKIDNAIQNFTVGADKANAADGLNITNGGRFDIVGKDGNYIETNVSGSNITVALNQNATEAIEKAHKGFSLKAQDGNNVTKQLGEAIEVEGGNSNINTTVVDGKVKVNLNNSLDLTETGNVKIGDVNLTKEGLTINGGPNVTKAGIDAGSKKITNVADGDIAENSKDAVNGGQLYTAIKDSGFNLATNGEDVATDKRINNNETFNLNQSTNILVKQVDNGYEIATADNVTFTNITVGKDGKDGVIGVNGADGKGVVLNGKDGSIGLKGKDGVSANFTVANGTGTLDEPNKGKEGIERLVYNTTNKDGTTTTREIATKDDGLIFKGDDDKEIAKKLGSTLNITGGANKDALTDKNIGVNNENGTLTVKLAKDLNLTENGSVKIGDVNLSNGGLTITGGPNITKDGINAGNKTITNVANGTNPTDAVNLSQLNASAKAAKTEVVAGRNVNVTNATGDAGQTIYTVNAEKSVVSNGSSNITVTATPNATTGITDYSVDLSDETKAQIKKEESVVAASDRVTVTQTKTNETGGKEFEVDVNAQKVVEAAQLPVVYTNKDGDKLVKVGDKFYKAGDVTNGTANADATEVPKADVIASLNNGDNNTTAPMTLSNLQSTLDKVTNTTTSNPDKTGTKYDNATHNAATVGDVLNAGWNLKNNGKDVDFVTHGNSVNFNDGQGVKVSTDYNSTTGTTNITFNTTNSYVDSNGNPTTEPSNKVKFIGAENDKPVSITNVDSGVLPNNKAIPEGKSFNDVLNNITGSDLNNVVNVGDLQNATKNIMNTSLQAVGFALKTTNVSGTNGVAEELTGLTDEGKRLTNNETFNLNASNNIQIKQVENGFEVATTENVTFTNITVGKDGKDGTIGVNGQNGTGVVLNGKDGTIGINGKDGASANFTVANGTGTLDTDDKGGNGIERLVYNTTNTDGSTMTREIATKDDGLKFKGDKGDEIAKKLGETLNITGGVSDEAKLTDNNIGVITKDGNLTVKLAKDLNLTDNGSLTIGDVNLTKEGLTIANGPSITKNGIDAGDKKITNVTAGTLSADSKDAVNGSQLYATNQNVTNITNEVEKGWNLTTSQSGTGKVSGNSTEKVAMGETVTIEAGDNINITQSGKKVTIATSNNITVGTAGKDGQDGVDGTIGVNGKDGSAVVINGKDGSIGLTGPKGADGKGAGIALNGKDGAIGINGKDGASANFTVANGTGTLDTDDKGGNGIERLVYNTTNTDGSTTTREIATKDDGLKFKGDKGDAVAKKLGETLNITGGVSDEAKLTDNNIGVITKDGNLTVKLAKDLNLTENGSLAIGNVTLNKDGFNAGNTTITNVKGNLDAVTNDTTSNPDATGDKYANITHNAATVGDVLNAGWNLKENGNAVDFVTHGNTVNFKNGQGVKVGTTYNSTTGTTDITFNTTNSYVDDNGNATAEPTNKVKFIGGNASAPVSITNVDSGVLPNNASLPEGKTFNDVLNNLTGDALTNVVNAGDLKNATKDITNSTLNAVGFTLASKAVADTNGQSSEKEGLSEADKRLTNNETFTLDAGNNVRIKQIENGYEVSTADNVTFTNITVGKDGQDGVDGTIGVNGKDGASVVLNGKDGTIGINGKDGASANFTVANGTGTLDTLEKGGNGIERLVYNTTNTDGTTTTREIATKDDGLKFKGDSGDEIAKKLGETLNITGGLTDSNKLTDNNLGVINQAGGLVVKLAKELNLTKDGSLTIGNTTLNDNGFTLVGGPNITTSGINAGDKKITNVSDGNVSSGSKEAINGGQLYTAITNSGFNLTTKAVTGTNGQSSAEGLSDEDKRLANNETFTLDAGNNLVIKQIANGYEIATSNNITVGAAGQDGVDGTIGVNGKDGSAVVINGKDGSIGLTGPKGADGKGAGIALNGKDGAIGINGKDGASANFTVANGTGTLDTDDKGGNGIERLVYNTTNTDGSTTTREIATKDDGLKFKGDKGDAVAKKLGETLNITGGVSDEAKLTDNNIGVITKDGNLTVKLAKDLNLTENGSLAIGNVTLNKDGFNAGNTTITNVKGNLDAVTNDTTSNPDATGDKYANITHNAATVGDVLNAGWNLKENGNAVDFVTHGNTVNFKNGQGVKVGTTYNSTTGTTDITFNTTNSYVDDNGNATAEPTNKVKFIGGNASAPVSITNVDSGVLPNNASLPEGKTFNDVLNNLTGDALTNVVNAGDLKNATKDITNTTLQAVGFALKSAKVAGSNGMVETASDLNEAGKRLTNNETFSLNAGNNIVIKQINDGYEIATANNITVGAAGKDGVDGTIGVNGKDGASVVLNGKDGSIGLTGPKGADGKGAGIALNGKDGTIGINGKDGASANFTVANGTGTLDTPEKGGNGIERLVYNTTNADGSTTTREIATKDDGLKFKGDKGDEIAKKLGETLNITGGVSDEGKLTDNNIGVITKDGNLTVKLAKDLNLTKDGSVTIGNTTLNDKGLTIAGGPSVTVDGINAGDKQITNVANGTNATDAVNLSQLNASMAAATTEVVEGKNVTVTNTTVADGHKIYTVNAEKSIVKGSDNVSVIGKTDTANFTTTYEIDLSDAMKKQIAKEESVTAGDTNIKVDPNGTNASGGKDFAVSLNKDLNLTKDGSVTIGGTTLKDGNLTMGNTTVGNDGLTIKDGPSITQNGIDAGNKVVNNVADGDISPNSKQAINGGQLHTAITNSGFNLATNGQDTATDKRINNNETFNLNQGNNIVVKQIDNGYEISTGNNLVIGEKGEPGKDGQPGKDGVDGSVGVNGKDGSSVVINGKDGSIGLTGPRGADGKDGASANISVKNGTKGLDGNDGKDGESKTRIEYVKQDGSTETVATLNDGLEFMGDTGTVSKQKLNSRVNVVGGQTDATKLSDKANIGVVSDGKGTLSVKLAKDVDLGQEGSVTIGDTIINNDGVSIKDGPSINSKGINAGSKVISNVAPGVKGTDAVNVSQLKEMGNQIGRHINSIDNKVNKNRKRSDAGISGVAAMSNIPQVMLPGKSGLGVGVGTKNGQSAIAVGYSRASDNGRHIIKVSTSYDSQKNFTGGAGYMYQW